ncbi:MAG: tryptophan--tRNA ligase [Clostridiales bacterium]|nr:tryptophan--tRNA ligase [Clostridiales bacterium]
MEEKKARLFSAVQPSGIPTIANYIGAIKNWVALQDSYECIYSIADLHTLTVRQVPAQLRQRTVELLALYLACGVDPNKSVMFVQSHVPQHAELAWILNTITYPGELARMTQYKDKSQRHADNVNMGLMDYPVLMAADILLYNAEVVPVGKDQKQHLEIARDLAVRFNNRYSPTFAVPEGIIPKVGANVMSLQDPMHKMSKSDANENAFISMADDKDTIIRKFKRAVTDSENSISFDENRPGISNLMTIYSVFTGLSFAEIESKFAGVGYGQFKIEVGEAVADLVCKIDAKKKEYLADKGYLEGVMAEGREKAYYMASKMLNKVYKKVGLYIPERKK